MNAILLEMIHRRANEQWAGGEITASNYHQWATHWLFHAQEIALDFERQGYTMTAAEVQKIVDHTGSML